MHRSFAGSNEEIFRNLPDPHHFFESPTHEEALARLHFLVENGRQAGLLVGESGTGKSLLLQEFMRRLQRPGFQTALVDLVGLEGNEMLWQVAIQLGLNLDPDLPRHTIWRLLGDRINENRYQHVTTVVMLDDIDQASQEIMHQVQRLLQIASSPDSKLTVLLIADVEGIKRVDPRLLTLTDLRIELEAWDENDTAKYLAHRLRRAGRDDIDFDWSAAAHIQRLSGGLPRRVSQLAELALIASSDRRPGSINEQTVAAVYEELSVARAVG